MILCPVLLQYCWPLCNFHLQAIQEASEEKFSCVVDYTQVFLGLLKLTTTTIIRKTTSFSTFSLPTAPPPLKSSPPSFLILSLKTEMTLRLQFRILMSYKRPKELKQRSGHWLTGSFSLSFSLSSGH